MSYLDEKILFACLPVSNSKLREKIFVDSLAIHDLHHKKRNYTEKSEDKSNNTTTHHLHTKSFYQIPR